MLLHLSSFCLCSSGDEQTTFPSACDLLDHISMITGANVFHVALCTGHKVQNCHNVAGCVTLIVLVPWSLAQKSLAVQPSLCSLELE